MAQAKRSTPKAAPRKASKTASRSASNKTAPTNARSARAKASGLASSTQVKPPTRPATKPKTATTAATQPGTEPAAKPSKNDVFLQKQRERLLALRDSLLDSMAGVSKDTLRSRAEGSEASAFGMHQADAGSDAYDRDFALNLLSQEQDALYEIEEALKRIDLGTYGICEMSGNMIPRSRLEAIPFARYTVECQAEIEKQQRGMRIRRPVTSLFGLTDEEPGDDDDDDLPTDNKE